MVFAIFLEILSSDEYTNMQVFETKNLIVASKVKTVHILLSGTVWTSLQTLKRSFGIVQFFNSSKNVL